MEQNPLFFYFAYGYNLNSDYFRERLKNGSWLPDKIHKTGVLDGPEPVDLGTYVLPDYQFSYNLDLQKYNENGTVGNISHFPGHQVFGVLYRISETQLQRLDRSEEVPRIYDRLLVKVYQPGTAHTFVEAWIDIGHSQADTPTPHPQSDYVNTIVNSATKRHFPQDYIDKYLRFPPKTNQKSN